MNGLDFPLHEINVVNRTR